MQQSDNYAPLLEERSDFELEISGEIPKELNGTLYRNGPNAQFSSPDIENHWFSGDGMLHAFSLEEGRASYQNRWVRTPKWKAERRAGRQLVGAFGRPLGENAPKDSGTANTHVIWHAGRLLALEEAHLPTEILPGSLETIGYHNFNAAVSGPFTAHPKIDPSNGELLFFGYAATGHLSPSIRYGAVDAAGLLKSTHIFDAPYTSMVHDFIVTQDYALFPILPLTGSIERLKHGQPPFAWERGKGAYVGLLRRDSPGSGIRWFRGEECYVFHVMNSWQEGDKIHAHVMQCAEPPFFPRTGTHDYNPERTQTKLCKWTFDLTSRSDQFSQTYLDDLFGEFPRIDDRNAGFAYRFGYYACQIQDGRARSIAPASRAGGQKHTSDYFNAIARIDFATNERTLRVRPNGGGVSEPIFVPRSAGADEGDGWLLVVAWDRRENCSELLILDSSDISRHPIATVRLPRRVPFGFHGTWVARDPEC